MFSLRTCSAEDFVSRARYYDTIRSKIVETLTKKNVVESCLLDHQLFAHHLSKNVDDLSDQDFVELLNDIRDHSIDLLNHIHNYNSAIKSDRKDLGAGPCAPVIGKFGPDDKELSVDRDTILVDLAITQKYFNSDKEIKLLGASKTFTLYDSFSNRKIRESKAQDVASQSASVESEKVSQK